MEIACREEGAVVVAAVTGSVDSLSAEAFEARIGREIEGGWVRLAIDLAGVDYVSSAGLRALLGAAKAARAGGGDLRLAAVPADVERVLDLAGFTSILKLYASVGDALRSFDE